MPDASPNPINMKIAKLFVIFCLLALAIPATAQTAPKNAALDGRWYFTFDLPDSVYRAAFAFKTDANGVVTPVNLGEPNVYLTGGTLVADALKLNGKSAFGDVVVTAKFDGEKVVGRWQVGFVGGTVEGVREPDTKSRTNYALVFEEAWKTIRDKFYDPKFNGVDWTAVGATYRPQAAKASTDAEFMNAVRSMLKELKVSHTGFYYAPFERDLTPKPVAPKTPSAAPLASTTWKTLAPGIGYMQIKQFTESPEAIAEIDAAFKELGELPNLVIDLRGNTGGTLSVAMRIGDYIYPKTTYGGFFATRDGLRRFKRDSMDALKPGDLTVYSGYRLTEFWSAVDRDGAVAVASGGRAKHYAGRIVVLIDGRCASTTEGFVAVLQELGAATLVGSRTRGAVLSAVSEKIAGDWLVRYPKADFRTPKGKRIESVGVDPDVPAEKGKELERALEFLAKP